LLNTDLQFGRFKAVGSFEGAICDCSLTFSQLSQQYIMQLFSQGKKELKESQTLTTSKDLFTKSQQNFKKSAYSKQTSNILNTYYL
jgi:hypothetical protein